MGRTGNCFHKDVPSLPLGASISKTSWNLPASLGLRAEFSTASKKKLRAGHSRETRYKQISPVPHAPHPNSPNKLGSGRRPFSNPRPAQPPLPPGHSTCARKRGSSEAHRSLLRPVWPAKLEDFHREKRHPGLLVLGNVQSISGGGGWRDKGQGSCLQPSHACCCFNGRRKKPQTLEGAPTGPGPRRPHPAGGV